MSKLGSTITVKVDPAGNDGIDEAAAIVTGVHKDGSLRIRVLGAAGTDDTVRNYVNDHGEPFDYEAAEAAAAKAASSSTSSSSASSSTPAKAAPAKRSTPAKRTSSRRK